MLNCVSVVASFYILIIVISMLLFLMCRFRFCTCYLHCSVSGQTPNSAQGVSPRPSEAEFLIKCFLKSKEVVILLFSKIHKGSVS